MAVDLFLVWAVRSRRDVLFAVAVAVSANVAGVLTAGPLGLVDTWVSAGLHAVFPVTLYRMHQPACPLVTAKPAEPPAEEPVPAETMPGTGLRQDFEASALDAPQEEPATPPSAEDVRKVIAELEDRNGRTVTGGMLAQHYGVSKRTGRRYLAMAGDA
ncbi:transfer protein spdA [Streptomyces sp. NPDC001914]|uniref:transfer protein spdA n=1 Tax=Streptomyces sp. NPDC001914 TaxID=3364623 RepID=UPI00369D094A